MKEASLHEIATCTGKDTLVLPILPEQYSDYASKVSKRVVYECYKPESLEETKEYIRFILFYRSIICNEIGLNSVETEHVPDISFERPPVDLSQKLTNYLRDTGRHRKDQKNNVILWFDSNFECANLERAIMISEDEYELYVNSDTNAPNTFQWFFFSVENTKAKQKVKFTVMNITRYAKFYAENEMKPVVFSETDYKKHIKWNNNNIDNCKLSKVIDYNYQYGARSIPLKPNTILQHESGSNIQYYSLSFSYIFEYDNDKVYFAFSSPYSYTRLNRVLSRIEGKLFESSVKARCENVNSRPEIKIETKGLFYKRTHLCKTTGGIPLNLITLSAPKQKDLKQYIVITARVHATEAPGSNNMEGILEFLVGNDKIATELRKQYNFLIVPMMNPDGVVLGNTRLSLEGDDLNRCWDNPSPTNHPAVYRLKLLLRKLITNEKNEIKVFCDLHGHSKRFYSFIYACHDVFNATYYSWSSNRLLTQIMGTKCNLFDYHQCSFEVRADKLNTARVVVWKEFKVVHSFTLENSIFAYYSKDQMYLFTDKDYWNIGKALLLSLHEYGVILGKLNNKNKRTIVKHNDSKQIEEEYKKRKDVPLQIVNKVDIDVDNKKSQKPRPKSNFTKAETEAYSPRKKKNALIGKYFDHKVFDEIMKSLTNNDKSIKKKTSILNLDHNSQKVTIQELDQGRIPLKPKIVRMSVSRKMDAIKKATDSLSKRFMLESNNSNIKQSLQTKSHNSWKVKKNFNDTRNRPLPDSETYNEDKKAMPSKSGTKFVSKLKVAIQDSHSQDLVSIRRTHNEVVAQKHYKNKYFSNKSFGHSGIIVPSYEDIMTEKGCIRSPKETGFKNFAKQLGKNRINGMQWNHNLAQIGLYRPKMFPKEMAAFNKYGDKPSVL